MQLKKEWVIPSIVGAVSFGTGAGVGYFLAKRTYQDVEIITAVEVEKPEEPEDVNVQMQFEFEERTRVFNKMIAEMSYVLHQLKDDGHTHLDTIAHRLFEANMNAEKRAANERAVQEIEIEEEQIEIPDTIFKDNSDGDWDYTAELPGRGKDFPYIIHHDEYYANEMDCTHTTLTYYKGDDILVDEDDAPIYSYARIVGELKFGHGSKDPSIVYVRNELLGAEYEVILDHGFFQIEVLGQQLEDDLGKDVKHSVRKFRVE